jgi:hypothetical protein
MTRIGVLLGLALLALASTATAAGQSAIDVQDSSAGSDFPAGLLFSITAEVSGPVDEVRLVYEVAPDGVRATAVADCSGGALVTCRVALDAERNVLIPGAEVTYFWRFTTAGATEETVPQVAVYEDTRFDWRTLSDGNLTIWWYDGDEDEARGVLAAGRESLDRISALLQTTVDFPVKIFYYDTAQDMQLAILSDRGEGVITRGEVVYSDTAMVSADVVPGDITRHEIAHIVVRQAIGSAAGFPDWLHEGTAVYAQLQPLSDQLDALDLAIQSGDVLSVRSLSSASTGSAGRVSLFYGQSWSIVTFLIETYGEEKYAELFRAYRDGATTAEALQQVYGFDQDGLENEWRASVGLPPREVPSPRDVSAQEPTPNPTADDTLEPEGDDGPPIVMIIVIVAVTAVLAGGLALAGLALMRRYR